jgi:hypothetical protein
VNGWKAKTLLLIAGSLAGAATPTARHAYRYTCDFVSYFSALETSNIPAGFREKVMLSLVLANSSSGRTTCGDSRGAGSAAM